MWCTRWFLPLLLLPLPSAPPYFLILFILSLTMHAKPCFYCIVLLTTLFVSSCYWQPFPIDNPLTTPWSQNITTFSDALSVSLSSNYSRPLPTVMRAVDRCWCDFSGSFFEPFNVSHWEYLSVLRVSQDLDKKQKLETAAAEAHQVAEVKEIAAVDQKESAEGEEFLEPIYGNSTILHEESSISSTALVTPFPANFWSRLMPKSQPSPSSPPSSSAVSHPMTSTPVEVGTPSKTPTIAISAPTDVPPPMPDPNVKLPTLRREYDLRPYGLGLIIDLGWSR